MRDVESTTQTMTISEVKKRLSSLVDDVSRAERRILVEKAGVPVAVLVSTQELERLDRLDRSRAERFAVIDRVRDAFEGVPSEEIERETDRIIAENRAKDRASANLASAHE